MRGYCEKCEEYRTDDGSDVWGFIWYSGMPICLRCQSVLELPADGQYSGAVDIEQEDDSYHELEHEDNGLFG